jgi:GalNAc5-diNAcBac-PP-undecaprenol beta-1,3-glucosyltransferase
MEARATVIIPTYGNAPFSRWAIKSVQQQTVKDIEICIICDGSPENMVSFFKELAKKDNRIKIYVYPKSPRTGEPYRDIVIKETTGKIICYCGHDDLWLPYHIRTIEKKLKRCWFTHSIHAVVNLPENIKDDEIIFSSVNWIDLRDPAIIKKMLGGQNFFGLTYGAHRRKCYNELKEGWTTTPLKDTPTDLYMWCKFLSAFGKHCRTTMKVTALNFPKVIREDWSEQERSDELKDYFERIQDPAFLRNIHEQSFIFCPLSLQPFQKIKIHFYKKIRNFIKTIAPQSQHE